MRNVGESMAGRAAILHLLPISLAESPKVALIGGGYPEVIARPRSRQLWFASYVQTYLERDLRAASVIQDLPRFRRFMALLATRHGTAVNESDLAAPLGVSIPTISHWIDILEITGLIALYWLDSGAGLPSARAGNAGTTGALAVSGRDLRGIRRRRDSQGADQQRPAARALHLPRLPGPGSRLPAAGPRRNADDDRGQSHSPPPLK
jgi:DNA-binding transcriptional ArsR family regulator